MLKALHPDLLKSFDRLPGNQPVAFLTRHSLREQPKNGFANYEVPLTAEGVALAEALGKAIERPVAGFYSSPVQRCVDTARAMAEGLGYREATIHETPYLVEPGSYVQEIEKVGRLFFKLGPVAFASKHLKGEVRGVLSPEQGTLQILRHLKETLGEGNELTVHVTHDTILAAFVYCLLGHDELDDSHWPWMMEGVFVWFDEGQVHWIWRGEYHCTETFYVDE
ncbi:MAG: histidine phosphatase family protein [Ketobacteraceae bacterium]|nr:histidine phosphatase family protein [Ketobacteraceae bacterium]